MAMIRTFKVTATCLVAFATSAAGQVTVRFVNVSMANVPSTLFDGWRAGACRADEHRLVPFTMTLAFGVVEPLHPGCDLEFMAIAKVRRPMIVTPSQLRVLTTGTLRGMWATTIYLKFQSPDNAPIVLWVADWDGSTDWIHFMATTVATTMNHGRLGIRATWTTRDLTTNSTAIGLLNQGCAGASNIRAAGFHRADALNIYVTDFPDTENGRFCGAGGEDMMFVKPWGSPAIMAHEIGHALSLEHTDDLDGFSGDNVMYQYVYEPAELSFGQVYRTQIDRASWLNRETALASRPLVKTCQPAPGPGVCPLLKSGMLSW